MWCQAQYKLCTQADISVTTEGLSVLVELHLDTGQHSVSFLNYSTVMSYSVTLLLRLHNPYPHLPALCSSQEMSQECWKSGIIPMCLNADCRSPYICILSYHWTWTNIIAVNTYICRFIKQRKINICKEYIFVISINNFTNIYWIFPLSRIKLRQILEWQFNNWTWWLSNTVTLRQRTSPASLQWRYSRI